MADEKAEKNNNIDLDDIDELPDVVLGEKTRAMRAIHENGEEKETTDEKLRDLFDEPVSSDDFIEPAREEDTHPIQIPDDFEKSGLLGDTLNPLTNEEDAGTTFSTGNKPVEKKEAELKRKPRASSLDNTEGIARKLADSVSDSDKGKKQNLANTDQIAASLQNAVNGIPDPSDQPEQTDENEIPTSVIDDIPGVENDLDNVLNPKKSEHDVTDPLPPVSNELSKVYAGSDETAVKGKHVHHPDGQSSTETMQTDTTTDTSTTPVQIAEPDHPTEKTDAVKDTKKQRKKKKRRTPLLQRIITFILIILLILLALGIYGIYRSLQPVADESTPVSFQVKEGETIRQVADDLADQGIIRDSRSGYYYARLNHLTDVKQGVFQLDKSWSLKQMFTYLNDDLAADQDAVMVTLTEGDWAKDMADKISKSTNVKADDLMALWNNDDYIRKNLMPSYPFLTDDIFNENVKVDLEGYLAPDTYTFNKETTAEEVTKKILDQSADIYQKYADQIKNSGYSVHQIYTLASIVQGESSREDQMKKIASVFYNRLRQDMPLQSSVTTCYIIDFDKGKTDWQECEASYNTDKQDPYNTYQNKGLPPGPVQNPGEAALNAVLNPDQTDDLFFMADVCGGTGIHYAKTEAEHEANVAKYNTCS